MHTQSSTTCDLCQTIAEKIAFLDYLFPLVIILKNSNENTSNKGIDSGIVYMESVGVCSMLFFFDFGNRDVLRFLLKCILMWWDVLVWGHSDSSIATNTRENTLMKSHGCKSKWFEPAFHGFLHYICTSLFLYKFPALKLKLWSSNRSDGNSLVWTYNTNH